MYHYINKNGKLYQTSPRIANCRKLHSRLVLILKLRLYKYFSMFKPPVSFSINDEVYVQIELLYLLSKSYVQSCNMMKSVKLYFYCITFSSVRYTKVRISKKFMTVTTRNSSHNEMWVYHVKLYCKWNKQSKLIDIDASWEEKFTITIMLGYFAC